MPTKFLNVAVTPGKAWSAGEKATIAKLNQTANPTVAIDGELNDLDNVSASTPSNNQVLYYNGSTSKWTAGAVPTMVGASLSAAGTGGAVPQPAIGDQDKYLRGDGSWATPTVTVDPWYYYFTNAI
jgi:hypothetical protein